MRACYASGMRNAIIGLVVVALLVLGWFLFVRNRVNQTSTTQPQVTVAPNAFTSIKDALTKSISLQCEYKDEEGRTTSSFIKNGAVRADVVATDPKESGSVIIKDNKMYSWNGREGVTMAFAEDQIKDAQDSVAQNQDVLENIEKYKDRCKPAVVSDVLFTPPTDVKFTDLSEMMKLVPTGATTQTTPGNNPQDIQKMMDQYQTPSSAPAEENQ